MQVQSDIVREEGKLLAVESDHDIASLAQRHKDIGQAVLEETAALHAGDAANRRLWREFLPACLDEMDRVYQLLNISFDHALGESFYHEALPDVVAELKAKGIAEESDGAQCVFFEEFRAPMIVQKRDGAFLYATTDLATIQYRMREWDPDAILYVVDHRQSQHFNQLFAVARKWGYSDVELQHISFGAVLGKDGKPYKTRSGSAVGLAGLLHEAIHRALKTVSENDDAARRRSFLTTSAAKSRAEDRHWRRQVCRSGPQPRERLRIQLRQDVGYERQYRNLHAVQLRSHLQHL